MKSLSLFIDEHMDSLGTELNIGDYALYKSIKVTIYGEITEIIEGDKPKYVIKTMGWKGDESLKALVKKEYKVNVDSKNIFKINLIKKN